MKTMVLRLICLALAAFLVFGLAGCGKSDTSSFQEDMGDFDLDNLDDEDEAEAEEADQGESGTGDSKQGSGKASSGNNGLDSLTWNQVLAQLPKNLKGSTITVASWNPAKEVTGAEGVISNFEKATGIKVNWKTVSYADYDSKIAALENSGNSPDLIRYYSPSIHRMYLCQDVQSATGFDFKGDIWDSRVTSLYTIKGKIYGVNLRNTFVNQPKVIMYKKSVIEKYKLDDPYILWKNGNWNWDTFYEMCKKFLEVKPDGNPWITYNAVDYMDFSGYTLFKFDGKSYTSAIGDQNIYQCLKKMCDYRKSNIVSEAVRDQKVFPQGNSLFLTFNSIANRKTNANLTDVKQDGDLYCVPIPTIAGREDIQTFSELEAYGIPKGAKNAGAVYYFLRYYLDANNYDANNFFTNKQAYEVYQACMAKSEFAVSTDGEILGGEVGGGLAGLCDYIRKGGDASQLQHELDEIAPKFKAAADKANDVLKQFP